MCKRKPVFVGQAHTKIAHQLPVSINLYVFEGLKLHEIASFLRISVGTSKSNLFDARSILKREILKINGQRKKISDAR
jgi:hypothetical protein